MTIKEYITKKIDKELLLGKDVAKILGVTPTMVTMYMKKDFMPSIKVAKRVYKHDKVVLFPFSEEALL